MECHLILSNGVPCVHDEAICQFFGHMFIPEFIWKKNLSLIRHGIAHICPGSHYFYPAADSSLHTVSTAYHFFRKERSGINGFFFFPNEHLKSFGVQLKWTLPLQKRDWEGSSMCFNSESMNYGRLFNHFF